MPNEILLLKGRLGTKSKLKPVRATHCGHLFAKPKGRRGSRTLRIPSRRSVSQREITVVSSILFPACILFY
jgi:hypothetical protein